MESPFLTNSSHGQYTRSDSDDVPTLIMHIEIRNLNPKDTCIIQFWDHKSQFRTDAGGERKT